MQLHDVLDIFEGKYIDLILYILVDFPNSTLLSLDQILFIRNTA